MNYKECKDMSLQLINKYSVAGQLVDLAYNNQADYINKIVPLINDVQIYLATTVKKIPAVFTIVQPTVSTGRTDYGSYYKYAAPTDFFDIAGLGIPYTADEDIDMTGAYKWVGNSICIDKELEGTFYVDYYKYPTILTTPVADTTNLENAIEVQMCIPYYVAAHLIVQDNPSLSAILTNEFETKLSRIAETIRTEYIEINNVYDFKGGEVY